MATSGLALTTLLPACGPTAAGPQQSSKDLKFVGSGDAAAQARVQAYLSAFQKSSGLSVNFIPIQDYYTENVLAMTGAGVPPDVLYVSRAEFDVLYPANKLTELTSLLMRDHTKLNAYFPLVLKEWQRNDKQMIMPLGFRTLGMAYNTGLFQQSQVALPPPDWSAQGWAIADFVNAVIKTTYPGTPAKDPDYGFYVDPTYLVWSTFVQNAGGVVVDEQSHTVDVDKPEAIGALAALASVMTKPGVLPPKNLVSADNGLNVFANGNLSLTITDPSTIPLRQRDAHFFWDVGVMPGGPGGRGTTGTGSGYGVVAGSKVADNAWKLVQYLTSEPVQTQEARVGQWIPSLQSVANSATFLPELANPDLYPQRMKLFVDVINGGKVYLQPAVSNWPAVLNALEAGIQDLWTGKAQPDAVAAQMKKLAEPILNGK